MQYAAGRVQRLWQHQHFLSRRSLDRGLFSLGDRARMRRFAHKLLSGQPLSVTALGGSVTSGNGAYARRPEDQPLSVGYVKRFEQFLQAVSPEAGHVVKNSALSGVTSGVYSVCANDMVQRDADLVILEFGMNDPTDLAGFRRQERLGFERLVRKALEFPNRPAVVILNHYAYIIAGGSHNTTGDFLMTAENELDVIGQYYGLPLLSIRAAAYHLMRANATGFKSEHGRQKSSATSTHVCSAHPPSADPIHPYGKTGHWALADLLVALIQESALSLAQAPLGAADEAEAQEPVPEPMVAGNYHRPTSTCLLLLDFERMVAEQRGFEWRNERPDAQMAAQKWGWIADQPGAWALLQFDTTTNLKGELQSDENEVVLTHLKSYERMGRARVACESGCTCEDTVIDGYWEREASLTELHRFKATPHRECRVRVTVLRESSSPDGGHKVKLAGVIVVEGLFQAYGSDLDVMANLGSKEVPPLEKQRRRLAASGPSSQGVGRGDGGLQKGSQLGLGGRE
ncbi:hypothetical protein ABPG75_001490 [Micractinium tetrahymenae]